MAVPVKVLRTLDSLVGTILRMSFTDEATATFAIDTLTSTLDRLQIGAASVGVSDTAMVRAVAAAAATGGQSLPIRELYAAGTPVATAAAVVLTGCGGLTSTVFSSMLDSSATFEALSRALSVAGPDALPDLWASVALRAGTQPADALLASPQLAAAACAAISADTSSRFVTRLLCDLSNPPPADLAPLVTRLVAQAPKAGWFPLYSRALSSGGSSGPAWAALALSCARAAAAGAPSAAPVGDDQRCVFYVDGVGRFDLAAAAATPALMSALVEFASALSPAHRWVLAAAAVGARLPTVASPLVTIAAASPAGSVGAMDVKELAWALEATSPVGGGVEGPLATAMVALQKETAASPDWWRVWCASLATLPAFATSGTLPAAASSGKRLGLEPLTRALQALTAVIDAAPAGSAAPAFPFDAVLGALGVADTGAPEVWGTAAALAQLARREAVTAQATLALSSALAAAGALRAPPPSPGMFSCVLAEAIAAPSRAAATGLQAAVGLLCGGAVSAEAAPELHVAAAVLGVALGTPGAAAAVPLRFQAPLAAVSVPLAALLRLVGRVWADGAVPQAAVEAIGAYADAAVAAAEGGALANSDVMALAAFVTVRCPTAALARKAAGLLAKVTGASDYDLSEASPHLFAAQTAAVGARLAPEAAPLLVALAKAAVGTLDGMVRIFIGASAVLAAADAASPLPAEAWVLAARELSALWATTPVVTSASAFRPQWGCSEVTPSGRTATTFCDIVRSGGGMPQATQIDLSQLGLTADAFVPFATLAVSPQLARLTLYGNPLAGDAACVRVLAAASTAKITSLDMDGCGVASGAAAALAQMAEGGRLPVLESLDLRRNETLALADGDALRRVAKACAKLTAITVPAAIFPEGYELLNAAGTNVTSRA